MKLLNLFSITLVESLFFTKNKEVVIEFFTNQGSLSVTFLDVMYLGISNDLLDMDDDISVIEVSHEFRELKNSDLSKYLFQLDDITIKKDMFHVITIHGNTIIDLICKEVVIQEKFFKD